MANNCCYSGRVKSAGKKWGTWCKANLLFILFCFLFSCQAEKAVFTHYKPGSAYRVGVTTADINNDPALVESSDLEASTLPRSQVAAARFSESGQRAGFRQGTQNPSAKWIGRRVPKHSAIHTPAEKLIPSSAPGRAQTADDDPEKQANKPKVPGVAITAFVLGLVAVGALIVGLFAWLPGLLISLTAGVFSLSMSIGAIKTISQNPETYRGKGWAIAGMVLGIVWALCLLFILAIASALGGGH